MTDGAKLRRLTAGVGSARSLGAFPPSAGFAWRRQRRVISVSPIYGCVFDFAD